MAERLTAEERLTLKTGAFGAVFLVSNADPGVVAVFRESFAASGALTDASGVVKEALTTGPLPRLPRDSTLEIESVVLPALGRALEILREKSPADVAAYRDVVLAAADRVARAHRGVAPEEAAVIGRIRDALAEAT
ncbi:hypothetical protein [Micromonospora endolithica]|uniref:Uncharacterized protein n=1 Tax=Micromonospora endolithica TaxID=230091 RepID=A0A3A9ZNZ0_9ACTN|nr:hypothetical protein [Micromonospora endolithica]RKN49664.1 hypothetical protein D7223_08075 [Micromonospora endolithica]TWJ23636.1 hypothetical protein JD76_03775 [Micromonospora endolithica]